MMSFRKPLGCIWPSKQEAPPSPPPPCVPVPDPPLDDDDEAGTVYIKNCRGLGVMQVISIEEEALRTLLASRDSRRIYLLNCDTIECRNFLSRAYKFWYEQDDLDKNKNAEKKDVFRSCIYFVLCSIDRVCIDLLAKLRGYGYFSYLCYSTKIVSFENEQDLIDCFTRLNLESIKQLNEETIPGYEMNVPLSKLIQIDKRWVRDVKDVNRSRSEPYLDKDGKLGEIEEMDFTDVEENHKQLLHVRDCRRWAAMVELEFFIKPDSLQDPHTDESERTTTAFQVEVNVESRRDLSAVTVLALKVPTLRSLVVSGGNSRVLHQKLIRVLKDRPTESSPLEVRLNGFNYSLFASQELLDIFNQKKLVYMQVYLDYSNMATFDLLDKVLETISKSAYLQSLHFRMERRPYGKEDWVQISRFMEKLVMIAPTFVQPLTSFSLYELDRYSGEESARLLKNRKRIEKIMESMHDKHLQIVDALVGAVVLRRCQSGPINLLVVDIFKGLREFLFDASRYTQPTAFKPN